MESFTVHIYTRGLVLGAVAHTWTLMQSLAMFQRCVKITIRHEKRYTIGVHFCL
jgi:hypothetical protein